MKTASRLLLALVIATGLRIVAIGADLENAQLSLNLKSSTEADSLLQSAAWSPQDRPVFRGITDKKDVQSWLAKLLTVAGQGSAEPWKVESGDIFRQASSCLCYDGLLVTRHIELVKQGTTFRVYASLKNTSGKDLRIERFPVWKDCWDLGSVTPTVDWWDSLTFEPHRAELGLGKRVSLSSIMYSSDRKDGKGNNPFWCLRAGRRHFYFSLSWCGGWRADIERKDSGVGFEIILPPDETRLVLKPGEEIRGPIVNVTAVEADSDAEARAKWLTQRRALDAKLYGGPEPWYPLIYNHWYSARTNFDLPFLQGQLAEFKRWGVFGLFVLDHGWFEKVGDWRPAKAKFSQGELESFYESLGKAVIKRGIWSCPWLKAVDDGQFGPEIDEPRFHRRFMDAYSLDLAGMDYNKYLVDHIAQLKDQFAIDWWKYDQELFGEGSRQGKMKKTLALEGSLLAVRRAYPKLNIENCMSGGRMINAMTDGISQSHWIRDGSHTGLHHARSNFKESLGAAYFLPLAKIQRWTNRPDETNPTNTELLKQYCRSAMVGVWGISADLTKISPQARRVMLAEVERYRRLNEFKPSNRTHIHYPRREQSKLAGIVFYDLPKSRAAVLLMRWQEKEAIVERIPLGALPGEGPYRVTDSDTGKTRVFKVGELRTPGLPVAMAPSRRSAIIWIER